MSGSKGGEAPVRSGGYQPTTSQGSSKPPVFVPTQPSSVQPPKK
jgi:hypothetical protein